MTTKTSMGRALLQSDRNAMVFIDVLRSYVAGKKFKVHDFVVMPDHVHLVITVNGDMAIEKAVQFIEGGFSYLLKKETPHTGEESTTRAVSRNIGNTLRRIRWSVDS